MCGIAGIIGQSHPKIIQAMINKIVHRGPDDCGIWIDPHAPVALGHRRLAIIDLSPTGHQPMSYCNERYWIVFNGEIYNYLDLRARLTKMGYAFRSSSDTETILAAYAAWGESCLEHMRGMFAFALYDRGDDKTEAHLFLARDRFGIKPLYYTQKNGAFLFASEIKGLLASGLVSKQVNLSSLWYYLTLGSIPQPETALAEIKMLMPGYFMRVFLNGQNTCPTQYWNLAENAYRSFPNNKILNKTEAIYEMRHLLEEATRLHMISEAPIGAFLSGGIDSTTIVGLMSQLTSKPLKTFSIGFENRLSNRNELVYAKIAAKQFGTEHSEIILTDHIITEEYDRLVQAIDQPSFDGTNTYFVSKAAHTTTKVSLSGLGGDELLAGYPHFLYFQQAETVWGKLCSFLLPATNKYTMRFLPHRWRPSAIFFASSAIERYTNLRCLAQDSEKLMMLGPIFDFSRSYPPIAELYLPWIQNNLDTLARVSYMEVKGYLTNTLLRDADSMSMAHALEIRPVLLDHVLAEFIFSLPPGLKINHGVKKAILIDAVRELIPSKILHRPKQGFEMPLWEWLTHPLKNRAQIIFQSSTARVVFSSTFLQEIVRQLNHPETPQPRLWGYLMLLEWLQYNQIV